MVDPKKKMTLETEEKNSNSNLTSDKESNKVSLLPSVIQLAASGVIPGGTRDNFEYTKPFVYYDKVIAKTQRLVLNDAQTSGGLLISLPNNKSQKLSEYLKENGVKEGVLDIGRKIPVKGSKVFAALKGVLDAGIG